jgi:hypothetical protein
MSEVQSTGAAAMSAATTAAAGATMTQAQEVQALEQAEAAIKAQGASAVDTGAVIEAWFAKNFNDSVVSRSTEVFNHVRTAVNDLKKQLAG